MTRDKRKDQLTGLLILIIAFIITGITRSGGQPGTRSYIESQKQDVSQIADNQFCIKLSNEISGTMTYKEAIYRDCTGK